MRRRNKLRDLNGVAAAINYAYMKIAIERGELLNATKFMELYLINEKKFDVPQTQQEIINFTDEILNIMYGNPQSVK